MGQANKGFMKIKIERSQEINITTIQIYMKVRDEFACIVKDETGKDIKDHDGYVPSFFPGEHFGDYLILDIDIETGLIKNWKKPTPSELEGFINSAD